MEVKVTAVPWSFQIQEPPEEIEQKSEPEPYFAVDLDRNVIVDLGQHTDIAQAALVAQRYPRTAMLAPLRFYKDWAAYHKLFTNHDKSVFYLLVIDPRTNHPRLVEYTPSPSKTIH